MTSPALPPAGWYADPDGTGRRYWDGNRWTEHRQFVPPPVPNALGSQYGSYPEGPAAFSPPVRAQPWPGPTAPSGFGNRVLAGWWSRVGAAILDGLILLMMCVIAGVVIGLGIGLSGQDTSSQLLVNVIAAGAGLVVGAIYYGVLMARNGARNGQTWGMQATGIRVIRVDGQPMRVGLVLVRQILVQQLLFGTLGFLLLIPTFLNYLWPLWDKENRALHDMMCSTRVVIAGA